MLKRSTCLILGSTLMLPAYADTHITFVDDQGKVSSQIFVKGGKVRMEGGDSAGQGVGLYDAASNTMTVMMPADKKYLVFNDASAAQVGAQASASQQAQADAQAKLAQHQAEMDQANQQMETATANLTPEQKAMLQQMNPSHLPQNNPMAAAGGLQVQTKELGTSETVAGHGCKDVELTVNGRPSAILCIINSPGALGIPSADLKTLQSMHEGMQKVMSKMGAMGQGMASMLGTGFSLKTTRQSFRNFQAVSETETFKSASSAPLAASLFQLPAGYTQTTMEELMQGGHQ